MTERLEELVSVKSTALVVIDMQNEFCSINGESGKVGDHTLIVEAAENLVRFLREARIRSVPIIHVKTLHSEWDEGRAWLTARKNKPPMCQVGTWGAELWEEFAELWPKQREYVVIKHRFSAFAGTDLDMVLRSRRIDSVVLTGVVTNFCIESTARDAVSLNYKVIVLADCTAAKNRELHEFSLDIIAQSFGTVTTSGKVVKVWGTLNQQEP